MKLVIYVLCVLVCAIGYLILCENSGEKALGKSDAPRAKFRGGSTRGGAGDISIIDNNQ